MNNAPKTMSLHDITEEYLKIEEFLIESGGEISDELGQQWDELTQITEDKLANYIRVIRRMEAAANAYKEEYDRLKYNADVLKRSVKTIKSRLLEAMKQMGIQESTTSVGKIYLAKNGGKQSLAYKVEPKDLPAHLREAVTTYVPTEDLVRAILKEKPESLTDYVELVPRGQHVRIK